MSRLVREDRAASSEALYLCISSCRDVIIKEKYDLADQLISRLSGDTKFKSRSQHRRYSFACVGYSSIQIGGWNATSIQPDIHTRQAAPRFTQPNV